MEIENALSCTQCLSLNSQDATFCRIYGKEFIKKTYLISKNASFLDQKWDNISNFFFVEFMEWLISKPHSLKFQTSASGLVNIMFRLMQPYDYDDMPMWEYWGDYGTPIPIWGMILLMIIGGLVVIAIMVALLVFLKKEALRRNINNVEIWILIFLGLNVVGLVIYLVMRDIYPLKTTTKPEPNMS